MARPRKNNADYFSHDSGMRNNRKLKALRNKYGLEAYAVWCMLLEVLTDSDNAILENSDLELKLLAGDFGVEEEKLKEYINTFCEFQLIIKTEKEIYCPELINRFDSLYKKRERKRRYNEKYYGSLIEEEKGVMDVHNPQSKVKESKEEKSKEECCNDEEKPKKNNDFKSIMETYNKICVSLPKCLKLSDERIKHLKSRLKEPEFKNNIIKIFEKSEDSDLLSGRLKQNNIHMNWKANFDWIIKNNSNYIKILECKYDNKKSSLKDIKKVCTRKDCVNGYYRVGTNLHKCYVCNRWKINK